MISSRPHQKIGIEKPVSDRPISAWSNRLPRFSAATTPAGMPMPMANTIAKKDSSMVAGKSWKNSVSTRSLVTIEVPKSPCRSCQT